jgi:SAM-dependent methyltransferase
MNTGFLSKKIAKPLHRLFVLSNRVKILSNHLYHLLPQKEPLTGLDVGCGNGEIAWKIEQLSPNIEFSGVDVLIRRDALINVIEFDGHTLPFNDKSFDFIMLVDVLHHTNDPERILKECSRVARRFILIKDHICISSWDRMRLCFMDWFHNRGYDVYLPYNFLSKKDWEELYKVSEVVCEIEMNDLNLYPLPFSYLFDSKLHFISRLAIQGNQE